MPRPVRPAARQAITCRAVSRRAVLGTCIAQTALLLPHCGMRAAVSSAPLQLINIICRHRLWLRAMPGTVTVVRQVHVVEHGQLRRGVFEACRAQVIIIPCQPSAPAGCIKLCWPCSHAHVHMLHSSLLTLPGRWSYSQTLCNPLASSHSSWSILVLAHCQTAATTRQACYGHPALCTMHVGLNPSSAGRSCCVP